MHIAALLALALLAALTCFQALLIAGLPLGKFAWGGGQNVLPTKLRIASALSIVLYLLFALIIASAASLVSIVSASVSAVGIWVLTVYFVIGIIMNAISRSKPERLVMTPIAALLAISCLVIALA